MNDESLLNGPLLDDENLSGEALREIIQIRHDKLSALKSQGRDPFIETAFKKNHSAVQIIKNYPKNDNKKVKIAGRIMSKRIMGKASFSHILDQSGQIQIYLKADALAEKYEDYKKFDIGDIVGITGRVFLTNKGEISVAASDITLLSKSLNPLPEKWHGLRDTDLRYRKRYLDLIANPHVKSTFIKRSEIIRSIRALLDKKGFLEVETPVLSSLAGGAAARPFITHHNSLDLKMYLRIALELHLKRLIVGGFEKVYEMGRMFRNEGLSIKHNPEFTMMELYEAYTGIEGMMQITEEIFEAAHFAVKKIELSNRLPPAQLSSQIASEPLNRTSSKTDTPAFQTESLEAGLNLHTVFYQDTPISLKRPFKRLSMAEAVLEYTGIDFSSISEVQAIKAAKEKGAQLQKGQATKGFALLALFDLYCEDKLIQPTFIFDYPLEVSPLAKRKAGTEFADRFELFIYGREMANGYSELNDPIDQRARFLAQADLKESGDENTHPFDEDYISALEYGMPPTGGLGVGIDRLVMLFSDSASIRDVLLFPAMKPRS